MDRRDHCACPDGAERLESRPEPADDGSSTVGNQLPSQPEKPGADDPGEPPTPTPEPASPPSPPENRRRGGWKRWTAALALTALCLGAGAAVWLFALGGTDFFATPATPRATPRPTVSEAEVLAMVAAALREGTPTPTAVPAGTSRSGFTFWLRPTSKPPLTATPRPTDTPPLTTAPRPTATPVPTATPLPTPRPTALPQRLRHLRQPRPGQRLRHRIPSPLPATPVTTGGRRGRRTGGGLRSSHPRMGAVRFM